MSFPSARDCSSDYGYWTLFRKVIALPRYFSVSAPPSTSPPVLRLSCSPRQRGFLRRLVRSGSDGLSRNWSGSGSRANREVGKSKFARHRWRERSRKSFRLHVGYANRTRERRLPPRSPISFSSAPNCWIASVVSGSAKLQKLIRQIIGQSRLNVEDERADPIRHRHTFTHSPFVVWLTVYTVGRISIRCSRRPVRLPVHG